MIQLVHLIGNTYTDGTSYEPLYSREMVNGQIVYSHQSGYGFLTEDRVTVVSAR